jgi:hypothetical protein
MNAPRSDDVGLSDYQRDLVTGDALEGLTDESLFPVLKDQEKRTAAFKMYMVSASSTQIASELGVDKQVVQRWICGGKWAVRLRELRKSRAEEEQVALDFFRQENRLNEAEDQLKAGQSGRKLVLRWLEVNGEDATADQLKKAAEALKAFSDLSARAVGIGETVETKGSDREEQTRKSAPCAVVIVNTSQPAPATGRTIEIKESRPA